jgi:hemerythrin superfamily protein
VTAIDILDLLTADHQAIEARFTELNDVGPDLVTQVFFKLTEELVRHEVAEEVVVYPAIQDATRGPEIAQARIAEQAEAEQQLALIEKLQPASSEFMAALQTLQGAVLAHAKKEESEVFPLLADMASQERAVLGERYEAAKSSAPTHPHPHAPDTPPGNKAIGPVVATVDRIRDAAGGL